MKKAILFGALAATIPAMGNPPPFLDTADDIRAVIYDKDVIGKLGNKHPIEQVTRLKDTEYEVESGGCQLKVDVEKVNPAPNEPAPLIPQRKVHLGTHTCP